MIFSVRRTVTAVTALVLSALVTQSQAGLITTSSSAPASAAISQPDFSAAAFNGGQDFTDNAGPPGQTFTATAATPLLSAVTLKGFANTGASFGGNVNTGTWTLTISQIAAGVMTNLTQETADPAAVTVGDAYVTFKLTTPVPLVNGTVYSFDVFSSTGYFGFAKSTTDVYAGGAAIQHGSTSRSAATGATVVNTQTVDRTFFINPAPVPEPSSAFLIGAGAMGLLARRRRSA